MIDMHESITAKLCSFARAYHSSFNRQKIFDDYLAFDMMGKQQYDEIGKLIERNYEINVLDNKVGFSGKAVYPITEKMISPIPLSRIAFAEKALKKFTDEKEKCQYVICGAGMDTFSFRNTNPDIKIIELDHPQTRKYKLKRLNELEWNIPQNVQFVPIDFSKNDLSNVLLQSGFDKNIPSFFAVLGVTYYLTYDVFEDTVNKISQITSYGDQLIFDFPDETTLSNYAAPRVRDLAKITEKLGEPMQHGFSYKEIDDILNRNNFVVKKHQDPHEIQTAYFSGRTDGQKAYENIHFIIAEKK